jgi:hypothetical protein
MTSSQLVHLTESVCAAVHFLSKVSERAVMAQITVLTRFDLLSGVGVVVRSLTGPLAVIKKQISCLAQ